MTVMSPVDVLLAAAALLFVTLGVLVLRLRPRRPVNMAFAAFVVASGLTHGLNIDAVVTWLGSAPYLVLFLHAAFVGKLALVVVALLYPRPLPRSTWGPAFGPPIVVAVAGFVLQAVDGLPWDTFGANAYIVAIFVLQSSLPWFGVLLPSRFAADRGEDPDSHQLARLAALFAILGGFGGGVALTFVARGDFPLWPELGFAALSMGVPLVLWLWATARASTPRAAKLARNVALLSAAAPLTGMIAAAMIPSSFQGFLAGASIAFVLALAYAVTRQQVLGLDVRLRWGLSKSTVAAAFITVFFIASEGAQILLGSGNEWVGLFAAGALVFAIAPLQRAAERLAEKAVPAADPSTPFGTHPYADAYALAVRTVVAAGRPTPEVDRHLADLADKLGIRAGEALRLRQAIEQEVAVP